MKTCTKCGNDFPATPEYFYRSGKGLRNDCKKCKNKQTIELRKSYPEERKQQVRENAKRSWDKNKEKYYAKQRQKYQDNPEYFKQLNKKYYESNKELLIEYATNYNKEHDALHKASTAKYRAKNREDIRIKGREYYRKNIDKSKKYYYANIEKHRHQNKKRRYLKANLPATLTIKEWNDCKELFNQMCCYCGETVKKLTQEHFIPVTKGGPYTKENILPACGTCNMSKNNRDFSTWYPEQRFYSLDREKKILNYLKGC